MQKHLKKHAFTLWLLLGVLLAIFFPGPAGQGGFLQSAVTTKLGVWIIFFLQGLSLPTSELTNGYKPKRLHAFVLGWNYLLFPIVTGLLLLLGSLVLSEDLSLGFWLLAILPTTVSSAVTFTAVSGGNTSNSIFSTVFSNLLSVLLVPTVAVAYLAAGEGASIALLPIFSKLALLIVLPLIIGQLIRQFAVNLASTVAKKTKSVGNWIIIFIVHAAFANSVQSGFLERLQWSSIIVVILATACLLLLVSWLVWTSSRWLHVNSSQRISGFYCASQKSLATGLPLATSVLASAPGVVDPALVLIPLMCYHPMQLVLAGIVSDVFKPSETNS